MKTEMLPWLSPDDSVECCELLQETAELLSQFAQFTTMRKELRSQLDEQARKCRDFKERVGRPIVERSLVLALDDIAEKMRVTTRAAIATIIEAHISKLNRSA